MVVVVLKSHAGCMLYVLLSGVSWTDVYLPSHGASARHGVQCSGVWNADYWLRWRRRCWHSKRRDCFEDVAAETCEHERSERDGFKPNWQRRRRVAVAVDRPAVCHHSAACVCSLCTVNSIPRAAGRPVFDKRRRRAGSVSTRSTTAFRCPSPEHALIRRTFVEWANESSVIDLVSVSNRKTLCCITRFAGVCLLVNRRRRDELKAKILSG